MKSFERICLALMAAGIVSSAGGAVHAETTEASKPISVDELVAFAEEVRVKDPARYAVMGPEVDQIVRKKWIATAGFVGVAVGGAIASFAARSMDSNTQKCDETTEYASYARADCYHDAVDEGTKYVFVGGGLVVTGLLTWLIARPSEEEIREAARNALWTPKVKVGISVDPEAMGAVGAVKATF